MVTGDFVHILTEKAEGQTSWLMNGLQVMGVEFFLYQLLFWSIKKWKGLWGDLSRLFFTNPEYYATRMIHKFILQNFFSVVNLSLRVYILAVS